MAETLVWIGEPSDEYNKKYKMWPKYTLWPFKIKDCDTPFYMNEVDYEVYLAEKALLDQFFGAIIAQGESRKTLIKLIETYGDKREEKGRHDVNEDWAESRAGESV